MATPYESVTRPSNWNVPNLITVVRILLAPVFIWMLLADNGAHDALRWAAAVLFIIAIATDGIDGMIARRPWGSEGALRAAAEEVADTLEPADWIEAIAHHPRIGDREVLRSKVAGWAGGEQGGVDAGDEDLLDALEAANLAYEQRFGFTFLVCATGSDGRQMLAALQERLAGDPATEWRVAAGEQRQITQLRISKLLDDINGG